MNTHTTLFLILVCAILVGSIEYFFRIRDQPIFSSQQSICESKNASMATVSVKSVSYPALKGNAYYDAMILKKTKRSMHQFQKFMARRNDVNHTFGRERRFSADTGKFAALVISPEFAFLHIWKCGGTTIEQAGMHQVPLGNPQVQGRKWVATVRDPIDRFLSAWAECGERRVNNEMKGLRLSVLDWRDPDYDFRVRAFLHELIEVTPPKQRNPDCHMHAFPQVNFMMNKDGAIDPHMAVVGDLTELPEVMDIVGFPSDRIRDVGRSSSGSTTKKEHFPSKRGLLKTETLLELCEYYAIDYFLFDFIPPAICVVNGGPLARYFGFT